MSRAYILSKSARSPRFRFNSKLRDELLDGEVFYSLAEAKVVIES